jgi:hypothetical protein
VEILRLGRDELIFLRYQILRLQRMRDELVERLSSKVVPPDERIWLEQLLLDIGIDLEPPVFHRPKHRES